VIKVDPADPDPAADADRRKLVPIDPVADRLWIELEVCGYFVDSEVFVIPTCVHQIESNWA